VAPMPLIFILGRACLINIEESFRALRGDALKN
jgi:hypothetical protein